jgi:hypothetical protein
MDNDVFRIVAFDFFEAGIQSRTEIDYGTLKLIAFFSGVRV